MRPTGEQGSTPASGTCATARSVIRTDDCARWCQGVVACSEPLRRCGRQLQGAPATAGGSITYEQLRARQQRLVAADGAVVLQASLDLRRPPLGAGGRCQVGALATHPEHLRDVPCLATASQCGDSRAHGPSVVARRSARPPVPMDGCQCLANDGQQIVGTVRCWQPPRALCSASRVISAPRWGFLCASKARHCCARPTSRDLLPSTASRPSTRSALNDPGDPCICNAACCAWPHLGGFLSTLRFAIALILGYDYDIQPTQFVKTEAKTVGTGSRIIS